MGSCTKVGAPAKFSAELFGIKELKDEVLDVLGFWCFLYKKHQNLPLDFVVNVA